MRRAAIAWLAIASACSSKERAAQIELDSPPIVYPEAGPPPTPKDTKLDAETHLAVAADGTVLMAWIGYAVSQPTTIGYRVSHDGGATWDARKGVFSPGYRASSDPVVAAAPSGDLWVTWIGFQRSGANVSDGHVYAARLPHGASELEAPVEVGSASQGSFFDKPWITITRTGRLVVSYAWFGSDATGLTVATSDDGATFARHDVATDPSFAGNLAYVCADPAGDRVWVTWWAAPGSIRARWSDDGGASWPAANALADLVAGN